MAVEFDATISVGNLISIAAFSIGGIAAFTALRQNVTELNKTIDAMKEQLKKMESVLIDLARQDMRITNVERRMEDVEDDVRRVRGYSK